MRRLLATAVLIVALFAMMQARAAMTFAVDGDWAAGSFGTDDWEDGSFGEATAQVEVPEVRGQADFATADGILEGEGLDGFELAPRCSPAPADEIVYQSPVPGTSVAFGTIVNLSASNGMVCDPTTGGFSSRRNRVAIAITIGVGQ